MPQAVVPQAAVPQATLPPTVVGSAMCGTCGVDLLADVNNARRGRRAQYCSNACRQRAYRRRAAEMFRAVSGPSPTQLRGIMELNQERRRRRAQASAGAAVVPCRASENAAPHAADKALATEM